MQTPAATRETVHTIPHMPPHHGKPQPRVLPIWCAQAPEAAPWARRHKNPRFRGVPRWARAQGGGRRTGDALRRCALSRGHCGSGPPPQRPGGKRTAKRAFDAHAGALHGRYGPPSGHNELGRVGHRSPAGGCSEHSPAFQLHGRLPPRRATHAARTRPHELAGNPFYPLDASKSPLRSRGTPVGRSTYWSGGEKGVTPFSPPLQLTRGLHTSPHAIRLVGVLSGARLRAARCRSTALVIATASGFNTPQASGRVAAKCARPWHWGAAQVIPSRHRPRPMCRFVVIASGAAGAEAAPALRPAQFPTVVGCVVSASRRLGRWAGRGGQARRPHRGRGHALLSLRIAEAYAILTAAEPYTVLAAYRVLRGWRSCRPGAPARSTHYLHPRRAPPRSASKPRPRQGNP